MKTTVNKSEFINWYKDSGSYNNNFSDEGLIALFDYLEQLEEDNDVEFNFDPIAFACAYSEWESIDEFNQAQGKECKSLEDISDLTTVIEVKNVYGNWDGRFITGEF